VRVTGLAAMRACSAAAALVVGGWTASAIPAYAVEPSADLTLTALTSTMAIGSTGKPFTVEVHNDGPAPAAHVVVEFDVSALDTTKLAADGPCAMAGTVLTCDLSEPGPLPAGGTVTAFVRLEHLGGAGAAGSVTAAVSAHTAHPHETDNTATRSIEIAGHGVDIVAFGSDVRFYRQLPGGPAGVLDWTMGNVGDESSDGLRYTVTLPRHVSFAKHDSFCQYSADNRMAECTPPHSGLAPGTSWAPDFDAGIPIKVDVQDPRPVTLPGGVVSGVGIIAESPAAATTPGPSSATHGSTVKVGAAALVGQDVDDGDNAFRFAVFVDAAPGASPSSQASGPPSGQSGGPPPSGTGGLPVTGDNVGYLAGAGLAATLAGIAFMVIARRRKIADAAASRGTTTD
jgi:LPXTG-motif cell wall-anchored protein